MQHRLRELGIPFKSVGQLKRQALRHQTSMVSSGGAAPHTSHTPLGDARRASRLSWAVSVVPGLPAAERCPECHL